MLLRAVLLAFVVLLAGAAPAQQESRPLDELLAGVEPLSIAGLEGRTETAVYRGTRLVSGREVITSVTMTLREEQLNREYHVPAEWPHGQKPLEDVLALSFRENWEENGSAFTRAWDLYRAEQTRKMGGVTVAPAGTVAWELQLWRERPVRVHLSHRDGEGSAQRSFARTRLDFFEEELPLILRQLAPEPGMSAAFRLFPTQGEGAIEPLEPAPARLRAEETGEGLAVFVEVADGREIRYEFDPEPPHALRTMEHNDGRRLERQSLRWREQ